MAALRIISRSGCEVFQAVMQHLALPCIIVALCVSYKIGVRSSFLQLDASNPWVTRETCTLLADGRSEFCEYEGPVCTGANPMIVYIGGDASGHRPSGPRNGELVVYSVDWREIASAIPAFVAAELGPAWSSWSAQAVPPAKGKRFTAQMNDAGDRQGLRLGGSCWWDVGVAHGAASVFAPLWAARQLDARAKGARVIPLPTEGEFYRQNVPREPSVAVPHFDYIGLRSAETCADCGELIAASGIKSVRHGYERLEELTDYLSSDAVLRRLLMLRHTGWGSYGMTLQLPWESRSGRAGCGRRIASGSVGPAAEPPPWTLRRRTATPAPPSGNLVCVPRTVLSSVIKDIFVSAADADAFRTAAYAAAATDDHAGATSASGVPHRGPSSTVEPVALRRPSTHPIPARRGVGVLRPHAPWSENGTLVPADPKSVMTLEALLTRASVNWAPMDAGPRIVPRDANVFSTRMGAWAEAVRAYAALDVLIIAPGAENVVPCCAPLGPPPVAYLQKGTAVVEFRPDSLEAYDGTRVRRMASMLDVKYAAASVGALPERVHTDDTPKWLIGAADELARLVGSQEAAAQACLAPLPATAFATNAAVTSDAVMDGIVSGSGVADAIDRPELEIRLRGDAIRLARSLACALSKCG